MNRVLMQIRDVNLVKVKHNYRQSKQLDLSVFWEQFSWNMAACDMIMVLFKIQDDVLLYIDRKR